MAVLIVLGIIGVIANNSNPDNSNTTYSTACVIPNDPQEDCTVAEAPVGSPCTCIDIEGLVWHGSVQ